MEPIQKIDVPNISIPVIGYNSPNWLFKIPQIPNNHPPVTLQLGFPIVEMPGCVTMHKDNQDHITKMPFDHDLVNQDEKGSTTLCPHGEYPTYDAMDYTPEQLIVQQEVPPPPVSPPPTPPDFKPDVIPKTNTKIPCPGPNQLRIGDLTQSGDERVIGHKLSDDGKICETLYESTTVIEKYVPPLNQVTTVSALAIVATAGAAATPLLIRIIKPVIKKLWTTIQKKIGKDVRKPSKSEIETNKYREKRGLPPLKPIKKKKK